MGIKISKADLVGEKHTAVLPGGKWIFLMFLDLLNTGTREDKHLQNNRILQN